VPPWSPLDARRLRGRAVSRDPGEGHRAATPLELLFDLTCVVAVSRAAAALHHELVEGHVADGVAGFAGGFFAVWWAWMNFTWFASAHDSDDPAYRVLTLVQMVGVVVLAAGIGSAVEDGDFLVVTIGYGIMRLGLVAGWLRVARDLPSTRRRALRYAAGLAGLQVLWFARLALPDDLALAALPLLVVAELAVPAWAERADRPTFHLGHIVERYGLFTIIVLGESILSATVGFEGVVGERGLSGELLAIGLAGLVLAFASWWLYFDHPGHLVPAPSQSFRWGYAHLLVFASLAAVGAGVYVAAEAAGGHGDERVAALAVAVPAAGYLVGLALVILVTGTRATDLTVWPKAAGAAVLVAIGALAPLGVAVPACAAVVVVLALWMVLTGPGEAGTAVQP
jgi:low temperature requirement protein LtrA